MRKKPFFPWRTAGGTARERSMNFRNVSVAVLGVALFALAWRAYSWAGIAVASGGVLMWVLLHFTRMVTILQRAGRRSVGHVDSAVMLNAKLKPRATLLHTIALTRALGELRSAKAAQPEVYCWTDAGGSYVNCEFDGGRLARWQLVRPAAGDDGQRQLPPRSGSPADPAAASQRPAARTVDAAPDGPGRP